MARWLVVGAAALTLAGCGGAGRTAITTSCRTKAEFRAMGRIQRDLVSLRKAGNVRVKSKLLGGSAANHATDQFLLDLEQAPISNLMRNRLIDHAVESVIANCQQCFQALEASRPVPSISHEGTGAKCQR